MLHREAAENQPRRMNVVAVVLLVVMLGAACSTVNSFRDKLSGSPPDSAPPADLMMQADQLVKEGQPSEARELYARAAVGPGSNDVQASALYHLARLYVDPASKLRDYRAGQLAFERLLAEHPNSTWAVEARAWRAVLADVLARQKEAARLRDETSKLKADLHARQAEGSRLREEASRLKADLQRLKQIDLELERRP